jgi:DNA-binding transcriptional LysR family regulator
LVVLDAVLRSGNVSKAAKELKLSQSATSSALARLREALDDPLLIRTAKGMVPTPRAEALANPVRDALRGLRQALDGPAHFNPGTSTKTFTLRATDFVQSVVLPPLLVELAVEAPGIRLSVKPPTGNLPTAELIAGELDLVMAPWSEGPSGFLKQKLFQEKFLTAARVDHPTLRDRLTLDDFVNAGHVIVSFRGDMVAPIDEELERMGRPRRVAVAVPYFHMALALVASSDLIATVPERLARAFAKQFALKLFPPPVAVTGFPIFQFWHERTNSSPEHQWLRSAVYRAASGGGGSRHSPHHREE